ncbi:MAG TPA: metal ABC transporter ATP-binding protein [Candidatus Megaira endosymbiont of Nemacystus decipiens]|nr:metal ABC transporter ATP-binding protein [Candidatus Megaera endosymbiont of Nemacystus decipiens]
MDKFLELISVNKTYGKTPLLKNVTFALQQGQITTLIGQNGAGKTTIAKIILGLESFDSGKVVIKPNTKIGYVPQQLDLDYTMPMRVLDLLETISGKKASIESEELEFISDLDKIYKKDISEISGGQLQKILLMGTILSKPDLLILDEPTQYLDVVSQQKFYSLISTLKSKYNMTIFIISHDLFTVMKNSDHVICINGHVCCSGKPAEIDNNIKFKKALSEIGLYVHQHDHTH